ncbi:MAG: tetratricopeptide repeat protein, partial [Pseudomonadota bacterium]
AVGLVQGGQLSEGVEMFERALRAQRAVAGKESADLVLPLSSLGNLLTKVGRAEEGERLLREGYELSQRALEQGHPHRAVVSINFGNLLLDTKRFVEAMPLLLEALSGFEQALGPSHPNVGLAHLSLGNLYSNPANAEDRSKD